MFRRAEGKYEAALKIKPDYDEALNNWGITLADHARRAVDACEADALLQQAEEKYEAVLKIKPDRHEALNNWGTALADRAARGGGPSVLGHFVGVAR